MHQVLVLTHNNLELTKKCVSSAWMQDVTTSMFVIDNGSTDGTNEWLSEMLGRVGSLSYPENLGVSRGWNEGLRLFLDDDEQDHVLVLNNDTIIPPFFYRTLLGCEVPFVTGVSFNDLDEVMKPPTVSLTPGPDFSAFLIRRSAWDLVGPFDEEMVSYASDNDWHVRAHRAGLDLLNSHVKFYHERSSTIKGADFRERRELCLQADADREVFRAKYGCLPWEPEYADLFK